MFTNEDGSEKYYRELKFERPALGSVSFLVDPKSGFNLSTDFDTLNRYFEADFIKSHGVDISYCGGRGQTILFALAPKDGCLLYGPKKYLKDDFNARQVKGYGGNSSFPELKVSAPNHESAKHALNHTVPVDKASEVSVPLLSGEEHAIVHDNNARLNYETTLIMHSKLYTKVCLRKYLRGGLVAKVNKDGYMRLSKSALRARDEFALLKHLYDLNLPVPRPLLARERTSGLYVYNDIILEQIQNSKNLAQLMEMNELTDKRLHSAGLMLKRFFDNNVLHTDLNIRNILMDKSESAFLIDFDKCRVLKNFGVKEINTMLERLKRSFKKELSLTTSLNDKECAQKAQDIMEPLITGVHGLEFTPFKLDEA